MANDSYSALSDPTRRRILSALRHGSRPVGELVEELEVSQPTVSKHLKVLRDTGLVATRAQGQKRFYSLELQALREVTDWIEELLARPDAAEETGQAEGATGPVADEPVPESVPEPAAESRALPWLSAPEPAAEESWEPDALTGDETSHSANVDSEGAKIPTYDVISDDEVTTEGNNLQELLEDPEVSNISTLPDAVALDAGEDLAGTSVVANTRVTSAEPSEDPAGSDDSSSPKPEFGIPAARSGGAHRRQSGLLSTLTGFRRRGRNSRR